jgi:Flp pilus assembly pilin Flp
MIGAVSNLRRRGHAPDETGGFHSVARPSVPEVESLTTWSRSRSGFVSCSAEFGFAGRACPPSAKEVNQVLNLYTFAQTFFARIRREEGQTMAEYAVVLAVVTLLVIGAVTLLSTNIGNEISKIAGILTK